MSKNSPPSLQEMENENSEDSPEEGNSISTETDPEEAETNISQDKSEPPLTESEKIRREVSKFRKEREEYRKILKEMETCIDDFGSVRDDIDTHSEKLEGLRNSLSGLEGKLSGLGVYVDELEEHRRIVKKLLQNQTNKLVEKGVRELEQLVDDFQRPLENTRDAIADDLIEAVEKIDSELEEILSTYKSIAQASGQLKHTSVRLLERSEELEEEVKSFSGFNDKMQITVEEAEEAASILKESTFDEDLKELKNLQEKHESMLKNRSVRVQEQVIQQVENRMTNLVTRFDAKGRNIAKQMKGADQLIERRLNTMQAIEDAFERYDEQIQQAVEDAKRLSLVDTLMLGVIMFCSVVGGGFVLDWFGIL